MSFGKNPHVAKAEAAELKAENATDAATRARAYRDAAHQWDRAADREKPGKFKAQYAENATRDRELADQPEALHETAPEAEAQIPADDATAASAPRLRLLS